MTDTRKSVIIGVLNWGLGHATRCIPLIRLMEQAGLKPVVASDGEALALLRAEFPHLPSEELSTYKMRYSKGNALMSVIMRSPRIWQASRSEHKQAQRLVEKYQAVGVISDNRLGFYHKKLPSVYISHQLKLMLPFARNIISAWHHNYIRRYDQCWVPDVEGANSLSGEMTQGVNPGIPVHFLGALSRFSVNDPPIESQRIYQSCSILSGPEPQRSLLEAKIIDQVRGLPGRHLLIRGQMTDQIVTRKMGNLEVIDFLSGEELVQRIQESEIVISRSGYTSIMDYSVLGNKGLLIPTPGQPEQEYLARYMLSKGWFYYNDQKMLDLALDIPKALSYNGLPGEVHKIDTEKILTLLRLFQRETKS